MGLLYMKRICHILCLLLFVAPAFAEPEENAGGEQTAKLQWQLSQMQEMMRNMNGKIEQLEHDMVQMANHMKRFIADSQFRLQEMEKNKNAPPSTEPKIIGKIIDKEVESSKTHIDRMLIGEDPLLKGEPTLPDPQKKEGSLTPRDIYGEAMDGLFAGQYDKARYGFAELLKKYPSNELAANAQYWLAETYYVKGKYRSAAKHFLKAYTEYSNSQKAPDSLLKLGMTLSALGEKKHACRTFAELEIKYPRLARSITQRVQIEKKRNKCAA